MLLSSIKWRLSLAASAVTIGVIAGVSFLEMALVRSDLKASITDQQTAFVTHVAKELDSKLEAHLNLLATSVQDLDETIVEHPDVFLDHYGRQAGVETLFDTVTLIRADGNVVTTYPQGGAGTNNNYSDRLYFQSIVKSGRPVISEPLRSRADHRPIVVMGVPVFSRTGKVDAVVAAILYLDRSNVLGDLATEKIGREGYFSILTRGDPPIYVVHPDRTRILGERPADGVSTTTRALQGFEGTVEGTNSSGTRELFTDVRLKSTGWMLTAALPTHEAFAAIDNAVQRILLISFCAALLVAPLAWALAWRVLTPVGKLADAVQRAGTSSDAWTDIGNLHSAEMNALAQTFNALMHRLETTRAELKSSEQWLRSITDNLPALICYIDREHRFRFNNRTYERWLAIPVADITGKLLVEVYGEQVYARLAPSIDCALAGEPTKFEVPFTGGDGVVRYARGRYVPHVDENGNVLGVFGLVTDETHLKSVELALSKSEKRLLDITNNIPAVIGQFDLEERCLFANDIGLKVHGLDRAQMATLTFGSHISKELYEQHATALADVRAGKRSVVHGRRVLGGREIWFEAHLVPDHDETGKQRGFFVMSFDVTTTKKAQLAQARSEKRVLDIANNLPVFICHVDPEERITYCNRTFRSYLDPDAPEPVGRKLGEILSTDLYALHGPLVRRCLNNERFETEVSSAIHGEVRHRRATYVPDVQGDAIVGATVLSVDVTALRNAERRLSRLAHFDALTRLPNRLQFNDALAAVFERECETSASIAVMFLDIDHFKAINDTHGHAAGDNVLVQFAERLSSSVRATDLCARLAGDEFVVLLDQLTTSEQAGQLASKIVKRIAKPFVIGSLSLRVTASIGIAFRDASVGNAGELLERADKALYQAKAAGRNTFRLVA